MSQGIVVNGKDVRDGELSDRNLNTGRAEMAGITEVSFETGGRPDPQDNIHTKDQILTLVADGVPSWMSGERYPSLAGRTDLHCYRDAVLVAAKDVSELHGDGYSELWFASPSFGARGDRYSALPVWRKQDWKIARELVAKMWNMRDEKQSTNTTTVRTLGSALKCNGRRLRRPLCMILNCADCLACT